MASLIPGYEYDIFVSYRQKDNKYDRWVTEFVANLRKELEATFKEDISIYFDENPHDGLLETHQVSKSLEGKLKCVIFIPVISQTYCDPKSYAWQEELCAFTELSARDLLGRDIRLANGNVASRILPVKIHELDRDDTLLLEKQLGGPLRAVEFIYKEPGVNRPLTDSDKQEANQNKTRYRNQVNKVANAIKEIVSGIRSKGSAPVYAKSDVTAPDGPRTRRIVIGVSAIVLAALSYFLVPWGRMFTIPGKSIIDSRIAVLPFDNNTGDSTLTALGDMAADWIITGLMSLDEVNVISFESIKANQGSIEGSGEQSLFVQRTGAERLVRGSIYKQKEKLIAQCQIVEPITGKIEVSLPEVTGSIYNTEELVNAIRSRVMTAIVSAKRLEDASIIKNPPKYEAYQLYLEAERVLSRTASRKLYRDAIKADSTFYRPAHQLAFTYINIGDLVKADSISDFIALHYKNLSAMDKLQFEYLKASIHGGKRVKYNLVKQIFAKDSRSINSIYRMAQEATHLNLPGEAASYYATYNPATLDVDAPLSNWLIHWNAYTLIRLGKHEEALRLFAYIPSGKSDGRNDITKAYLYMVMNHLDSLELLYDQVHRSGYSPARVVRFDCHVAEHCILLNPKNKEKWINRVSSTWKNLGANLNADKPLLARVLYLTGDLKGALREQLSLGDDLFAISRAGCIYAELGMKAEAYGMVERLDALYRTSSYGADKGLAFYGMACIVANLGEKEKAMEYLQKAFDQGMQFSFNSFDFDYELVSLFNYPPFVEFVKPKG